MRDDSLHWPLAASMAIHLLVLVLGSALIHNNLRRQEFQPIALVDLSPTAVPARDKKLDASSETNKSTPKIEKLKDTKAPAKSAIAKPEVGLASPAVVAKEDIAKSVETNSLAAPRTEASIVPSTAKAEGGGSEAGAAALTGKGDVGVVPGSGTTGGGGGTAASGPGRTAGAPGLPPQQTVLRTNRQAKAIQTVRAIYPAMALRAGLEGDVTLKIEVDPLGNVTKAEIVKSAGAGFDEEALKAVKQSRFEPAQRDGQNVAAGFAFIYRFRLQR